MKAVILLCLVAIALAVTTPAAPLNTTKAIEAKLMENKLSHSAAINVKIQVVKKREVELTNRINLDIALLKTEQAKLQAAQANLKKVAAAETKAATNATVVTAKTTVVVESAKAAVATVNNAKPAPVVAMSDAEKKLAAELNALELEELKVENQIKELAKKREEVKRQEERKAELLKLSKEIDRAEAEVKHATEDVKNVQKALNQHVTELHAAQARVRSYENELKRLNIEVKVQAAKLRKGQLVQEIVDDVNKINKEHARVNKAKEDLKKAMTQPTQAAPATVTPHKVVEVKKTAATSPNPLESELDKKINAELQALELTELNVQKQMRELAIKKANLRREKEREAELLKHATVLGRAKVEVQHASEDLQNAQKELERDIEEISGLQAKIHAYETEMSRIPK